MSAAVVRTVPTTVEITQVHMTVAPNGQVVVDLDVLWRLNGFPIPQSTKQLPLSKDDEKRVKALLENFTEIMYNAVLREKPSGVPRSE